MAEIRGYHASVAMLQREGDLRVDVSYPEAYIAELVAYNVMGAVAEFIGMIPERNEWALNIRELPGDIFALIQGHVQTLRERGYRITVL